MSGNDLTNDRNQRQETVLRTIPVLADGVLVVARQPKSFGAKHESSYLLGLNPKTGDFLWNAMLDKHPATMLTQSPVVYNGVVYIGASSNEEHEATDTKYECCSFVASNGGCRLEDRGPSLRAVRSPAVRRLRMAWSSGDRATNI